MALKGDRIESEHYIDFFMNETATRGGVVCVSTVGSGTAMDQSQQLATYKATPSGGKPLGMLLNDMVNLDLTRQKENVHKNEVQQGGKVTICPRGVFTTNMIITGQSPAAGSKAYLAHSGYLAAADVIGGGANLIVGAWLSSKDENGYAKVQIALPNIN